MEDLTIQEVFGKMPSAFRPERANGMVAVVQFLISGDDGGDWVVTIANNTCQVVAGKCTNPQLTISAEAGLLYDLLAGRKNGMAAFMQGKLHIRGDLALAQRLLGLFTMPGAG